MPAFWGYLVLLLCIGMAFALRYAIRQWVSVPLRLAFLLALLALACRFSCLHGGCHRFHF